MGMGTSAAAAAATMYIGPKWALSSRAQRILWEEKAQ